eukprot:SAG11_NODE_157_length_14147_cov_8.545202_23_plen_84_part_00
MNWGSLTQNVFAGAYAYSCLTRVPQQQQQTARAHEADVALAGGRGGATMADTTIGVLWESDGPQCKPGGQSCRTLFSVFPTNF